MRRHLLGGLTFVAAFAVGFSAAPMWFVPFASGQSFRGAFVAYKTRDFVKSSYHWEQADDESDPRLRFERYLIASSEFIDRRQEVIERTDDRALVWLGPSELGEGYCVFRLDGEWILAFYSTTRRHVLELERQTVSRWRR